MKALLSFADLYMQRSDWRDLALMKACLGAMGIFMGTFVTSGARLAVRVCTGIVFIGTYAVLMTKMIQLAISVFGTEEV